MPGLRVLLIRPISPNERFGLGPFFRVEPLGLEYIASALLARGHDVRIADLRFGPRLRALLESYAPHVVGVASMHTVDTDSALAAARTVKAYDQNIRTVLGGHAASVYPKPLFDPAVDAIVVEDGEAVVPALVDAWQRGIDPHTVPGLWLKGARNFVATRSSQDRVPLDLVPLPARHLIAPFQHKYRCVHKSPLFALETTRGCPYRCSFCSIWRHNERTFRLRSIDAVCRDFEEVGDALFIIDDLFFVPRARSLELAQELRRRGVKKDWILVQSRLDTVAKSRELLEAWRPIATTFDIFFGFEAPTNEQLAVLDKDMTLDSTEAGVRAARDYSYGVTGNFVVDPDWGEGEFQAMWELVDRLELNRSGFTVLTPLPGTPLYEQQKERLVETDWSKFDMHHILYEPKLGRARFFELFVESWKRNVLSPRYSRQKWLKWMRGLTPMQMLTLGRTLLQTQRQLKVEPYLEESFALQVPAALAEP